jgi:PAS domain S-box-containing protein
MPKLLVTDDQANRALELTDKLIRMGYEVIGTAGSGAEALLLAGRHRPELILMTIVLPGELDGIEAAARIKRELDIPVVFISDRSTTPEIVQKAIRADPLGYLIQPVQEVELRIALDLAFQRIRTGASLKHNEYRLRRALISWEAAFNAVPDPIVIIDLNRRIQRANEVFCKRLGKAHSGLIGQQCCEVIHGLCAPPDDCPHNLLIKTGREQRQERNEALLGGFFTVSVSPLYDEYGKFFGSVHVFRDITTQKRAQEALCSTNEELERKVQERTATLAETNIALKVLLRQREKDKEELGEHVLTNVKRLIRPYLGELKTAKVTPKQAALIQILESNLNDLISPFIVKLSLRYYDLSPMEITIANMIKKGRTNKEMAHLLGLSLSTILTHRHHLRTKLGLKNKKINLHSHLFSLEHTEG